MLENVGRLMSQHLVLFVVMRDEELEGLVRKAPAVAEDVSRAVVAAAIAASLATFWASQGQFRGW